LLLALHYCTKVGVFLGYLEVFGVTLCTGLERQCRGERGREQPWSAYLLLCVCLATSAGAGNLALSYINYPTKVVFRSCKV
jgi:adenosine 3'-phospho 5'-phosphosulfate transporter B3